MLGGRYVQQAQPGQPQRPATSQELAPFGGGHDPFAAFDGMMLSPFGGPRRSSGGGLFGDVFGHMDQMMQEMNSMVHGPGGQRSMAEFGSGNGMLFRGMGAGGGGSYSCQTMMFSSTMGRDGQMHTEKFASSSVGDFNQHMQEVQQAYSNSSTGVDKMSLERQLQGRGRKMVKEYSRQTGEERHTDLCRGMTEGQYQEFDRQWQAQAVPRLPQHQAGGVQALMGGGVAQGMVTSGRAPQVQQAVPQAQPRALPAPAAPQGSWYWR